MVETTLTAGFEKILEFWFPKRLSDEHAAMVSQFTWWFGGGANASVTERFTSVLEQAERGELDHWSSEPRSCLALIVILDQFSRSVYRDTARAYAQDAKALALALTGIELGYLAALHTPWEKTFFCLPLGHSEELEYQEQVVRITDELAQQAPSSLRRILEHSASQARGHRDVIARFGRHPHRNAVLGRRSTAGELEYLARGELVHMRAPSA